MRTTFTRTYKNGVVQSMTPLYGDNATIAIERERDQFYRRENLNVELVYLRDDFDIINNASVDDNFEVRLYETDGTTEHEIARGTFSKIDCQLDLDDKICRVKPHPTDMYTKILKGMDNQYNLINLAPVRESIQLTKRAILQFYMLNDSKITHVCGGGHYEVDVNPEVNYADLTDSDMVNTYHFRRLKKWRFYYIEDVDPTASGVDINGTYFGEFIESDEVFSGTFTNSETGLYIRLVGDEDTRVYTLHKPDGTRVKWYNSYDISSYDDADASFVTFRIAGSTSTAFVTENHRRYIYSRILSDKAQSGQELPSTDLSSNNLNYHYWYPPLMTVLNNPLVSLMPTSTTPTKWGKNDEGYYFSEPEHESTELVIPIAYNMWSPNSYWIVGNLSSTASYDEPYILKDAYPLWSAISVLLNEIDSEIKFEGTDSYSEFLYGSTFPWSFAYPLYISPITNVKKTYYTQAAQRGDISLGDILEMLRMCFQCYWYIEEVEVSGVMEKHLRIEHVRYYKHGGTYSNTDAWLVLLDLTAVKSQQPNKAWAFMQNAIEYDGSRLKSRYEFGWANEVTAPFNGYSIDINNRRCADAGTENNTVANFITDIDYAIGSPSTINDDLYALICTNNGVCPIYSPELEHETIPSLQNGHLSFINLANSVSSYLGFNGNMYSYNIDGNNITINGQFSSMGVEYRRIKTQKVTFPFNFDDIRSIGLITTDIGNGEIESIEINIETMSATATLLYNTN